MRPSKLITGTAVWGLVLFAPLAIAHTSVTNSIPRSGSELERPPAQVEIQFAHAVRMTSMVLIGRDGKEQRLEFTPTGSDETFTVAHPALAPGRNEIHWKALSGDGHVIDGTLIYTITPKADHTD